LVLLAETTLTAVRAAVGDAAYSAKTEIWLGFLNTVRTERFEQVLALRPSLLAIATAAHG
jgi:hypothetical protein